ncbi:uncharacterized protein LOC121973012 [Zingiber officinale]|uniref:uncharacterized protein LOC121973012 n=1 Tax=Zingiber officinale TaxID=94328 RepID=UPI001C4B5402|nr:uncharacterized protein LOC121973012 [Zingiber officinale]
MINPFNHGRSIAGAASPLPPNSLLCLAALAAFFTILRLNRSPAAVVPDEIGADLYERRHYLRLVYGTQHSTFAAVDVKFVFCKLTKVEQRFLVALEALRFGDIIVLNCTENMSAGETYSFLSALPAALAPRRYDYVMKTDDDSLVLVEALATALRPLPRRDLYYGLRRRQSGPLLRRLHVQHGVPAVVGRGRVDRDVGVARGGQGGPGGQGGG